MNDWFNLLGLPLWVWLFVFPTCLTLGCLLFSAFMARVLRPVWKLLDCVYAVSGIISALFMCLILLIILAQMFARWTGIVFEGSTEFAGYAMAATSFFALSYALGKGSHIRVSIFLNFNAFTAKWLDIFALFVGSMIATFFARYAVKTNFMSGMLNDRTQGQDQIPEALVYILKMFSTYPKDWATLWITYEEKWIFTPMWVPQLSMSIGTILLAICLWDHLYRMAATGVNPIKEEVLK